MKLQNIVEDFSLLFETASNFKNYEVIPTSTFDRNLQKFLLSGRYSKNQKKRIFAEIKEATEAFKIGGENDLPDHFLNHIFISANPLSPAFYGDFHLTVDGLHVFWTKYTKKPIVEFNGFGYP